MLRRDNIIVELFDLANRKGFAVTRGIQDDHVRLTAADGTRPKTADGSVGFSYEQAVAYLEDQPDCRLVVSS